MLRKRKREECERDEDGMIEQLDGVDDGVDSEVESDDDNYDWCCD